MIEFNTFEHQACFHRRQFVPLHTEQLWSCWSLKISNPIDSIFSVSPAEPAGEFNQTGFHMTSTLLAYTPTVSTAVTEKCRKTSVSYILVFKVTLKILYMYETLANRCLYQTHHNAGMNDTVHWKALFPPINPQTRQHRVLLWAKLQPN